MSSLASATIYLFGFQAVQWLPHLPHQKAEPKEEAIGPSHIPDRQKGTTRVAPHLLLQTTVAPTHVVHEEVKEEK